MAQVILSFATKAVDNRTKQVYHISIELGRDG